MIAPLPATAGGSCPAAERLAADATALALDTKSAEQAHQVEAALADQRWASVPAISRTRNIRPNRSAAVSEKGDDIFGISAPATPSSLVRKSVATRGAQKHEHEGRGRARQRGRRKEPQDDRVAHQHRGGSEHDAAKGDIQQLALDVLARSASSVTVTVLLMRPPRKPVSSMPRAP